MSLKRQLGVSFLVQGAGAASVLLATVWLGKRMGPEVQGSFSHAKSQIEFIAAFAMFGLPQALFYHLKSGGIGLKRAMRWAASSAMLALPIGWVAGAWAGQEARVSAVLALAIAAVVWHGQLRSLLLVRDRTVWFNIVTAAPQVLLLLGVVAILLRGGSSPGVLDWYVVFALAAALAAGLAQRRLRRGLALVAQTDSRIGWSSLAHYGLASWMTAALSTAAILAMQREVESTHGAGALGVFTIAMTLTQVPLTPISYAAPLLFRRWMEQPGAAASRRWASLMFLVLLGLAVLVGVASLEWPDLGLGISYRGVTLALAVLLAGAAAESASRLLTVQASAIGLPWVAVRAEATRWAMLLLAWLIGGAFAASHGLLVSCAAWAVAAWAAAAVFAWHGRRLA